jgi:hypothetical protein
MDQIRYPLAIGEWGYRACGAGLRHVEGRRRLFHPAHATFPIER